MARQTIAQSDVIGGKLVFTFSNGNKVEIDPKQLSDEIRDQLVMHGLTQKIRDSFAGAKGNVAEAEASASGVVEALLAGEWNRRGGGGYGGNLLAEAIAEIKEIDIGEARQRLAELTEDQIDALKKSKTVKAKILEIKARRAKPDADGDDSALDAL